MEKATIIKTPLENIDGFYKVMGSAKLIVINSNMALARQNFTLAHELYHLKYDDSRHDYNSVEEEANEYASYFLIPEYGLERAVEERKNLRKNKKLILADIIYLEQYFGVSHQAFMSRLNKQRLIAPEKHKEWTDIRITQEAKKLGFPTKMYEKTETSFEIDTDFIEIIANLYQEGKISEGKYNEFLRRNGLWEVVYGKIDDEEYE